MPNARDSAANKSRAYRETSKINSRLAVQAHKRGDTKERDFQLSMRKYNRNEANTYAAEFGRNVRINLAANKYKKNPK